MRSLFSICKQENTHIRFLQKKVLTSLRTLLDFFGFIFRFFVLLAKKLALFGAKSYLIFFRNIFVKVYRIYFFLYRKVNKLKPKAGSMLLHIFTNKNVTHATLGLMTFLIATTNIQAYEVRDDEFRDSLLYILIEPEELGYIVEEKVAYGSTDTAIQSLEVGRLARSDSPLTTETAPEEDVDPVAFTRGGTAIVKPNISGEEEIDRDIAEVYIVQSGDTIGAIAERLGLSINTLLWANDLTAKSFIQLGETLVIPPGNGVYYTVKRGETVSTIARKHDVDAQAIVDFNKLASADTIIIGQNIFIPNGKKLPAPAPRPSPFQGIKQIFSPDTTPSANRGDYIWPAVCHRITQYFGWRHTGVDIACNKGTAVYAARSGVVVKSGSGWNGGYGNVIIVDHGNGVQSLYAHNSDNLLGVGDIITQGQVIASMGSTGRSTGPHVHFEIRVNGRRVNPLEYVR